MVNSSYRWLLGLVGIITMGSPWSQSGPARTHSSRYSSHNRWIHSIQFKEATWACQIQRSSPRVHYSIITLIIISKEGTRRTRCTSREILGKRMARLTWSRLSVSASLQVHHRRCVRVSRQIDNKLYRDLKRRPLRIWILDMKLRSPSIIKQSTSLIN